MSPSPKLKRTAAAALALLGGSALFNAADAANAVFDPATSVLTISAVDVPNGTTHVNAPTFNAKLRLVHTAPFIKLELTEAAVIVTPNADRAHFDPVFGQVYLPSIDVGGTQFAATMKLIPGSNPMAFEVTGLHEKAFTGCPAFARPSNNVAGACVLEGEYNQNITLTNNTQWILSGGVFIGGDRTGSATITIEPGTRLVGRSGRDFLYIRRNSQIQAIGTPQHPIVMTGPNEQQPGEWAGLVIAGNAPANGCSEGFTGGCEQLDEALTTPYGGNNPNDNSGVIKYVSLRYAGFEIRPDEELNCLTMLGVGNGTTIDFAQCHMGADDGFEMFGGTVNMKHLVATFNGDDQFDWQIGWQGKAQYVLGMSLPDGSDAGIEADNNERNHNSLPRSHGKISNFTLIGNGSGVDGHGIVLRRGTGANIYNTVITGFGRSCMTLDNAATFEHGGMPGNLTGTLTMQNSHVQCDLDFNDRPAEPFLVSAWFNSQAGNVAGNVQLNGYLPAAGSPQLTGGAPVPNDPFFDAVNYVGAFANENDDWTKGWTIGLN
ncbi:MAG: hypothetical protein U1D70_13395 [Methylobacter sp.]|nr:hypothetical protein [Methylobacter sp.]MDP2428144.1 hypothetical protein [Methylobacter sp.]MDP3054388.1 hypothetical protein [Methylobacter sp.]MDP3362508.1 hypothetical protein [Methylobacter sp.]MDZ4220002.1 hypothetical protein [Methylobacter sp.]